MRRVSTPELLDSPDCPAEEVETSLRDLSRINRLFGGVSTTRKMIERVAEVTGKRGFSLLEVAAGFGEVPNAAARQLKQHGISLDITLLDLKASHLPRSSRAVVADALALPFPDGSFDLIGSSLFAHHLEPEGVSHFAAEALRVSRCAVLINDLVRHPLHLALVYAGFPLMRSYVSRIDGVASVKRAYLPEEMREMILPVASNRNGRLEIFRSYLFRMGVILWK